MGSPTHKRNIRPLIKPPRAEYSLDGYRAETVKRKLGIFYFALLAAAGVLVVLFLIMNAVRTDRAVADWWTEHIERGWEVFAGTLTSWLPFSLFELCVAALIIIGIYLFVRLVVNLCRARFTRIGAGLSWIAVGAAVVLDLYMMSMGFGYYRSAMPLVAAGADYTAEQAEAAARYFLDDYNALAERFERDGKGQVVCPYSISELGRLLVDEYARIDNDYLLDYTPRIKPITFGKVLSAFDIIGITFLPTGEANVNTDAPPTQITMTAAHELAHAKGIQREGDANLIAQYVLLTSADDYLRYCGYYNCFGELAFSVLLAGDEQGYNELYSQLSPKIAVERRAAFEYWSTQPDIVGQIGEFFNNIYLIFNGASNGTGSYNDGSQSGVIKPIDPDTGEQVIVPIYSDVQKMFFYLYELGAGEDQASSDSLPSA